MRRSSPWPFPSPLASLTAQAAGTLPAGDPTPPPTSKAQSTEKKATNPKGSQRQTDRSTVVTATYTPGAVRFAIRGAKNRQYAVALTSTGALSTSSATATVTSDGGGSASLVVPVTVADSGTGSLTASLSYGAPDNPLQTSGTLWIAHDSHGKVIDGGSQIEARVKAIKSDHPKVEDQLAAWAELTTVSPARESSTLVAAAPTAASATVVTGTVTYRDWNNVSHPARHLNVELNDVGFFGGNLASTTTDDQGNYSFTVNIGSATDIQVKFPAESSAGRVGVTGLLGFGWTSYSEHTSTHTINPGDHLTLGDDLQTGDAISNSFAILDAVWSAHLFAAASGNGSEDRVDVEYPTGDKAVS